MGKEALTDSNWLRGLLLLGVIVPGALAAQSVASRAVGVTAADTDRPIPDVEIAVVGYGEPVRTGQDGRAQLSVPLGEQTITARRLGFHPVQARIAQSDSGDILLQMRPVALTLPRTTIVGIAEPIGSLLKAVGFLERRDANATPRSAFWTAQDMERRGITSWSQLSGAVSGARVTGTNDLILRCGSPLVVVDGVPQRGRRLRDISLSEVAGLELYSSAAQVPIQFSGTASSGEPVACVALVWMRR